MTLRVVIDARLVSGQSGGVEAVIAGLASGLSKLDGPEEYVFAVGRGHEAWLDPYVSGPARTEVADFDPPVTQSLSVRLLNKGGRAGRHLAASIQFDATQAAIPAFEPSIERMNPSIVHMPRQRGFLTSVPSIYHPHDLQHVHLPEFFTDSDRTWRERVYGRLCRQASMVAVASEWTRRDVAGHFGLPEDKVRVISLAPPLSAAPMPTAEARAMVRARFALPDAYVLYPAQTWPHKNHIRLLGAIAKLKDEHGIIVPLVATGTQTPHSADVEAEAAALGIERQVHWTGFVPTTDLAAIFLDARAVVIPSLFEAASAPLWEAFLAGIPAACSNVTSLPDQAGDAAMVFDPLDVTSIAAAIAAIWRDEDLRSRLASRGRQRVSSLSWESTAATFRAHYRRLAGQTLSDDDLARVGSIA